MKFSYLFSAFLCLLLLSCNKTTTVSGTVKNSADDSPLEGVSVSLGQSRLDNGQWVSDSETSTTDKNGNYRVDFEGRKDEGVSFIAKKDSFTEKRTSVWSGDSKEINFKMYPIDSWLKLTLYNEHCFKGKIGGNYASPMYHDAVTSLGLHTISIGNSKELLWKVPGGGAIYIMWDTLTNKRENTDSVFIKRGDTTEYTIKF